MSNTYEKATKVAMDEGISAIEAAAMAGNRTRAPSEAARPQKLLQGEGEAMGCGF